jgi:hypothetical protein
VEEAATSTRWTLRRTSSTIAAPSGQLTGTLDGTLGFGTSPPIDAVVVIDVTTQPVTKQGSLHVAPLPGDGANQPHELGGGDPIVDGMLPISLPAAGQVALLDVERLRVQAIVPVASPLASIP